MIGSSTKQATLRRVKSLILPRPHPDTRPCIADGPVVVAGMFKTANGLGQLARSCVDSLREHGVDPVLVDLSDAFNQSDTSTELALDKMPLDEPGTLILHVNAPETEAALMALGLRRWHDWRIVGCWAWELTQAPPDWLTVAKYLTEIWTPSEFVSSVFRERVPIPVKTVPPGIRVPNQETAEPRQGGSLNVLSMADGRSSFHRKNVLAAVRIFKQAFDGGEDAQMTLKFRNLNEYPHFKAALADTINGEARIQVVDGSVPSEARWRMIAESDILISAHRAEGFGLHLAEAMALGRCVMATGWSANTEFMSDRNSALLPYELEPATDPFAVYDPPNGSVWAQVDEDASVEILRDLARNEDRRAALGQAARADVAATLHGGAYVNALGAKS